VTLIVSVLILIVVVGGVLWLYRGGVRGANGGPPTIGAPAGEARTPAPAQSSAPDTAAGLSIYKDNGASASGPPSFAPPPEEPAARPVASAPAPVAHPQAAQPKGADEIGDFLDKPPAAKAAKPVKPVIVAKVETPPVASAGGAAEVQIGAFSSAAQADQGWSGAAGVAPGPMAGKGKKVVPVTVDGKTLYRTFVTGFASHDAAQALCDRLKAAGRTCFVR
jgi:cell division protein FtsN